ncbi:MAG: tRNA (guanosine(46)-N7)-methyltransferase TrmB [Planctomycetales bacterium]|nr:tRNA (guanosine(46)-N7)-methyltransferase TrmB [Planctomycetales bacterium]NIM08562.1 tRNA (guanosine(46)-N7)-methyltransferase TrmB [Planctomycetales bacterium]NIN08033.1 tRNA (guanosine(46)-N7)-methyltransferase TrmB [Planctomycetales bacterium]NIN77169.1 tRNA (guanosine(46)-N7)-methyltransferase TrmB [Planctomycetales bacterium]NIO34351.1 tRNA (guanosine(46)-N7)-methyltransferase TrmB [Planctomycetales bacterium]
MARRALPKINPALDLSRHLLTFEQLSGPWDATALFGRRAPLELEVGSGKGLFLCNAAAADRDGDFLGIEVSRKYARFAAAKLAKRKLDNACLVHGDASRVLAELLPDGVLRAVHIYFPDPWWKKRHHKRRIMNARFLQHVQRTLRAGGQLHFWTDVKSYFDHALAILERETDLKGPRAVPPSVATHPMDYRTHFERRTRLQHQAVYRSRFTKQTA